MVRPVRIPARLHYAISSVPLRTPPSGRLKACQLPIIQYHKLTIIVIFFFLNFFLLHGARRQTVGLSFSSHCQFTLSITIQSISSACWRSSRHAQSSMAYSFVDREAEFSSSLDYSISSSGLSFTLMTHCRTGLMVQKM